MKLKFYNKLINWFSFRNGYTHSGKFNAESLTKILNYCIDVEVNGKVSVYEYRELIVGKNVSIGKNVKLYCLGGLIIGDNVIIEDNVIIGNKNRAKYSDSVDCKMPIMIPTNSIIKAKDDLSNLHSGSLYQSNSTQLNLFFVLSTGRSGSNAFSHIFSSHPAINCKHESFFLFNRLSTLFEHQIISTEELKHILKFLFSQLTLFDEETIIHGESDQKLVSFVPILNEILPKAKFIWLIRRAEDFVASAYGRGWMDDHEYAHHNPELFSFDTIAPKKIFDDFRLDYSIFRLSAYKAKVMTEDAWKSMSSFERNCWYWFFWNNKIEKAFEHISEDRKFFLPLENLNEKINEVLNFFNLDLLDLKFDKFNEATYDKYTKDKWSDQQLKIVQKYCEEKMNKWYSNQNIS